MPEFGDLVIIRSIDSRDRHGRGFFVRAAVSSAVINGGPYWELTDMRGDFWEVQGRALEQAEVRPLNVPALVSEVLARRGA
jgi:hypothetical protein